MNQRARSRVPLDHRSLFPGVPGLPWWGVVAAAAVPTALGVVVDGFRGDELTATTSVLYVLGCIVAAVCASRRAIFTSMVQPPILMFVLVPLGATLVAPERSVALRDLAITTAYPLVDRFPVMLLATAVAAAIGGTRLFLASRSTAGPSRTRSTSRSRSRTERTGSRRAGRAATTRGATETTDRSRRSDRSGGTRTTSRRSAAAGDDSRQPRSRRSAPRSDRIAPITDKTPPSASRTEAAGRPSAPPVPPTAPRRRPAGPGAPGAPGAGRGAAPRRSDPPPPPRRREQPEPPVGRP
ncbi:hypothetical protein DW322_18670 [Rhodococcus rhodnii]|uniref:DUF6542 domain-containing protein n=2 Tax=Rhodococcus rhodnii TaxID=38312 RepID=R7WJZ8_9NOCA|nr:hypothetical protein Rrhod_3111 [Rhodococcus rhodnii LMG 5362]TXG91832.1 hypothetical protein DW322_18670 [Rhodococcus rhodnii]